MNAFLNNKYTRWYLSITSKAKQLNRTKRARTNPDFEYFENHHIIPKSFFVKNGGPLEGNPEVSDNLVLLTPREHFICHWLLTKMCINTRLQMKACKAFEGMLNWQKTRQLSSAQYTKAKQYKQNNPISEETRRKQSKARKGKKHSETHKANLQKAKLLHYSDPEKRALMKRKHWETRKSKAVKHTFSHKEHGVFNVNVYELIDLFPDQKMTPNGLNLLVRKHHKVHRGWSFVDD